jgi:3-hydroxyacyl-CoA dehydrogenase
MGDMVRLQRHGDLAVIEIDHPPVNALSNALRREILAAVQEFIADPVLRAAVLVCVGKTFIAGADLREFDKPPGEVTTADICRALDASPKPVVVALHGTALGGGFEIALACHARIMAPDGRVGLPESRVGLIPGAGGTQHLVRLVGAIAALDMVTTGRHVPADEAVKLGLVEEIATDLRKQAINRARTLADAGSWPRVRDRAVPPCDRAAFDAAVAAVRRRARGALAPVRAAEAVGWALDLPFDEGVARERTAALELRGGPQSRALRHLFHAERIAARMPEVDGHVPKPWPLKHAGVVGGGTMGSGIAISLADSGLDVTLVEVNADAIRAAEGRIRTVYDRHLKTGRISPAVHAERLARIRFEENLAQLADTDIVIEATIEELPAKVETFRKLSAVVRRDCVLASNTSALNVNLMADVVDAPERVLGTHFFSPAHVMRLLEIVRADRTSPEVLSTAVALAKRIGKQAVISGVCDGFIGNRILAKWWRQCDFALEDGAYPQEVDAAVEAYGFAMGPYAVADLAGLDIGWAQRRAAAPTRDPRIRYVPITDWLCDMGRFGQKTGAGYYQHKDGKRVVDPLVNGLVERASAQRQIARRPVPPGEVQQRVHAAMVNEAVKILAEGIAQRPSDIDVVLVAGYGYPAWRGGPMFEADRIGLAVVLERVEKMYAADGVGWEPAPLLQEMVAAGRVFSDLNG